MTKAFSSRLPYVQVICVFLAFAIMVTASFLLGIRVESRHLESKARMLSENLEKQLSANLRETETMLGIVSETIRGMILHGADLEENKAYITEITDFGKRMEAVVGFVSIFAMFDVFGGIGINGLVPDLDWQKEDYNPRERPWYIAANKSNGEIVSTDPYVDFLANEVTITYARCIYDNDGSRIAIVCMDVLLNRIYDSLSENRNFGAHDWLLLDSNLNIIAYPFPEYLGMALRDAGGSGIEGIAGTLEQGMPVPAHRFVNPVWEMQILSVRQIENEWYIGVSTPVEVYYTNLKYILWFLVIFGLLMAFGLSVILMRIVSEKNRAEKRTQLMLNSSPFGINFLDKNFNVVDCNQAILNLFEVNNKEKFKSEFYNYAPLYQPDGKSSAEFKKEYLEKAGEEGVQHFEWMHQKPNGELMPTDVTIVASTLDGERISIAYLRDLRETKAAIAEKNKAISEKNMLSNLGNIMNGLDMMIYVTDPVTCEVLFMNDTMKKHFHVEGDCIGQLCYKVLQKGFDHKCDFCPCFMLDEKPGKEIFWEERSTLTGRIYRNVDRYIPWPNGKTVHMQHSADMTELIAAKESAERSSRYKSAFLANMSHEVRTPMNAILGIAEIQLQDKTISPNFLEAFGRIYESGDMLLNIINDILDLSKVEAGKLELNPVKYDIPSLINDSAQLNRLRYESKPIEFITEIDENTPVDLFGDELRIKQILNNILSNAFKYTDNGTVSFQVSSEPAPDSGSDYVTIIFRVRDTGQGMTEDEVARLFDEYTRFNTEANRSTIGAGLGMSITKRLVNMMGGTITVASEFGKGSLVTVSLLQKQISSAVCGPELVQKMRSFHYKSNTLTKKTRFIREYMPYGSVLVVDDVESNIFVINGMLFPYGIKVETASDGLEAVAKIKNGSVYDIVFMDHMMPKMDGIEAVRIIRQMGYTNPIVALTANALTGRAEMFRQNGFDGFISKPIDSRELNFFLNDFIRDRKPPEVVEAARREQQEKGLINTGESMQDMSDSSEMAELFVHDAEKAITVLEEVAKKAPALSKEDIGVFITAAHGMKSALANIGERAVSDMALKLEKAGDERNIGAIINETPSLIKTLQSLIEKYKSVRNDENAEVSDDDMNYLREKLLEIQTACAAFDKNGAKEALNSLKQRAWPSRINTLLDNISLNLLHSEFKKAIAAAGSALE